MDLESLVRTIAIYALPVLFAITLHEAAHGYVARHFGDMTAFAQGRISLNPARHIDAQGTIIAPLVILALTGGNFAFGWAKPVPVNYSALKNPKRDMALVAAAGPLSNFAMAIGWTLLFRLVAAIPANSLSEPLAHMAVAGVVVNIGLLVINLLPILPLDGGRVLAGLLPDNLSREFSKTERWGGLLFMLILVLSVVDSWMNDGKYVREFFSPLNNFIRSVIRAVLNS